MTFATESDIAPACQCIRRELRRRLIDGGGCQYRWQCLDCGRSVGSAVKRTEAVSFYRGCETEIPQWDERLHNDYWQTRENLWQERRERQNREREQHNIEWWRRYNLYLQSPQWKIKRAQVLRRAGNICEGCRRQKATQVHHLSYEHVFNEFLWELVAICDDCHERIHVAGEPQ
jgi:hypothetical protein